MSNWFLVKTTDDGRKMWQCGNSHPRAYIWQHGVDKFHWTMYGIDDNDNVASGKSTQLELAMSEANAALGEYNG